MGPSFLPQVVRHEIDGVAVAMVDARQLHAALRVGTLFALWIKRRIGSGRYVEGRDYAEDILFKSEKNSRNGDSRRGPGQPSTEYAITVGMAKHLALAERNDVGQAVRDHFIRCEEALRAADPDAHGDSVDRMRKDVEPTGQFTMATGGGIPLG